MQSKLISLFVILLLAGNSYAQTVYLFQYNFHQASDTNTYKALFIKFDDGSILARVRYQPPGASQAVVVNLSMEGQFDASRNDINASREILYFPIGHNFASGDPATPFTAPAFYFRYDSANDAMVPITVTLSYAKLFGQPEMGTFFSSRKLQGRLNKDLVGQYFDKGEGYYTIMTNLSSRGMPKNDHIKMHLIIVANTNDSMIGSSCKFDMERILGNFVDLAIYLGVEIKTQQVISGPTYNMKNVKKAIADLRPGDSDIVIFYYSGHGFRYLDDKTHTYPYIDLRANPKEDYNIKALNIETDVFKKLKSKKGRVRLVLSDCCNSDVGDRPSYAIAPGKPRGMMDQFRSDDNCRALFLGNPVNILATAAAPGEKAASNDDFGGFYTYYFISSLLSNCSILASDVKWEKILADVQKQTMYKSKYTYCDKPYVAANVCKQTPVVVISTK